MLFKDIVGQQEFKQRWVNLVDEQRVPHALLLTGNEGYGPLPLAIALAQYLNCKNRVNGDSCGVCPSCTKIAKLVHPDLHFVFPVTKSKKVNVSDDCLSAWRESVLNNPYITSDEWVANNEDNKQGSIYVAESDNILRKLSYKAYEGEYKIMIVWMADRMNQEAANKLLKLFEEPPAKTVFILITSHPEVIIPTILSRMQIWNIPRIDDNAMIEALVSQQGLSQSEACSLANMVGGDYSKALTRLKNNDDRDLYLSYFISWMRLCWTARSPQREKQKESMLELIRLSEKISSMGRENIKLFLLYCSSLMRKNLLAHYQRTDIAGFDDAENQFSQNFSKFIHENNIFEIIENLESAYNNIVSNGNEKIIITDLVIKLIRLIK